MTTDIAFEDLLIVVRAIEELRTDGLLAVDTQMALEALGFDAERFIQENK